jgi:serine/threonine protein kinase
MHRYAGAGGYDVLESLGSGSFSTVFKVRAKGQDPGGGIYVLKETSRFGSSASLRASVLREVQLLHTANHCEYMARFYLSFVENDNFYMVRWASPVKSTEWDADGVPGGLST